MIVPLYLTHLEWDEVNQVIQAVYKNLKGEWWLADKDYT
jgi:hypothetical protein